MAASPSGSLSITDPGQAPITVPGIGNPELSGLAHVGGGQYLAVADSGATLHTLQVDIDPNTALVTNVSASPTPVVLTPGSDLEGIAWRASTGTVFVSDETGAKIREYNPTTGAQVGSITVPSIYDFVRPNQSLESLTLSPDESSFWTANESALSVDGPTPTPSAGSLVRLQRFNGAGQADAQFAYLTDPGLLLGVVELLVLPTGELLVMERKFGAGGFEASLFVVDLNGATDTSAEPTLLSAGISPVGKTLLWNRVTGLNFEAVAIGPALSGGDLSLLLTSDGSGAVPPQVFALRLSVPEPATSALLILGLLAAARLRS